MRLRPGFGDSEPFEEDRPVPVGEEPFSKPALRPAEPSLFSSCNKEKESVVIHTDFLFHYLQLSGHKVRCFSSRKKSCFVAAQNSNFYRRSTPKFWLWPPKRGGSFLYDTNTSILVITPQKPIWLSPLQTVNGLVNIISKHKEHLTSLTREMIYSRLRPWARKPLPYEQVKLFSLKFLSACLAYLN